MDLSFAIASWTQGRGLRVTQNVYFSLLRHTKKLLLVIFCDLTAETGVHFRTDGGWTDVGRMDGGRTDRCGSQNSYLDLLD